MIAGSIDKLDVRIPGGTMLTTRTERRLRAAYITSSPNTYWLSSGNDIRGTRHYGCVYDLRQCGLNSILCFGHRRTGNHKLEVVGTGTMTLSEIVSEIKNVFQLDPMQAEIMRVDFAVDVPGYSVEWFRQNTRVARKRYTCDYDRVVAERKRVETLYFGKRPNIFRIYDKTEEQRVEYRRLNSKRTAGAFVPTFEERYGHREDEILTRVERQCGGGRVPRQIASLQHLQENAVNFNPFEPLRFLPVIISEQSVSGLVGDAFIKGHGILRLIERRGYHEAKRLMDEKTCRNADRLLAQVRNSTSTDFTRTPPDLAGIFREAINRQLDTPTRCL